LEKAFTDGAALEVIEARLADARTLLENHAFSGQVTTAATPRNNC
jgi:hypothetical protein